MLPAFPRLITRRERWGLTGFGWISLAVVLLMGSVGGAVTIHPFLSVNQRAATDEMVVEGWIHEYAIVAAAGEFVQGGYRRVLTTGGPVVGIGGYRNDFQTSASVGADNLKAAGVPSDRVVMVPSRVSGRDRTYSSAVALREWFRQQGAMPAAINVLTEDCHGRRTRLLFQKAFGRDVEIGIISVPNPDYDARRWWRYSEGVREVLGETLAYLYARLLFYPAPSAAINPAGALATTEPPPRNGTNLFHGSLSQSPFGNPCIFCCSRPPL
jgi:uncharacterized SAM-binding protein YcdF (DUF218 family)